MRAALCPAALAFALLLPSAAPAAEASAAAEADSRTAEAKARFKQGVALYKQGRWGEAVEEFETAYRLKPHGVVRFNVAQCYEKLGQVAQALKSYHLYLREVPEAEDKAAVQTSMAALEKSLADRGLQQLLVFSDPPGAELSVDGQAQGRTPWSGELPLGAHKVALSLPGHESASQDVLLADKSLPVEVRLAAAAAPPAATTTAPPEATKAPAATATRAGPEEKQRLWTWVVAGAAAASLVAAVGCGIAAQSASDQLRGSVHDQKTAQSLHDQAQSGATASNVLLGLGLAGAAAGGVLYFVGTF